VTGASDTRLFERLLLRMRSKKPPSNTAGSGDGPAWMTFALTAF
jgi:hypothetical protein